MANLTQIGFSKSLSDKLEPWLEKPTIQSVCEMHSHAQKGHDKWGNCGVISATKIMTAMVILTEMDKSREMDTDNEMPQILYEVCEALWPKASKKIKPEEAYGFILMKAKMANLRGSSDKALGKCVWIGAGLTAIGAVGTAFTGQTGLLEAGAYITGGAIAAKYLNRHLEDFSELIAGGSDHLRTVWNSIKVANSSQKTAQSESSQLEMGELAPQTE